MSLPLVYDLRKINIFAIETNFNNQQFTIVRRSCILKPLRETMAARVID